MIGKLIWSPLRSRCRLSSNSVSKEGEIAAATANWRVVEESRGEREEEKVFFTVIPISIYHSWLKDFCFLSHIPHRAPDASYPSEGSDGQTTFEALKQLLLIYPKCLFSSWIRREEAITRYLSKISMVAQMAKKIDKIKEMSQDEPREGETIAGERVQFKDEEP